MNKFVRILLIFSGSLSVGLGVIGIFLPLLPTTPFLLLGASCYLKSSSKLYKWLISNKYLGIYIKNYYEKKGIPLKAKIYALTLLWISISYSVFFIIEIQIVRIVLLIIALLVSGHIFTQHTLTKEEIEESKLLEN
ncbi:YbaN family protein [Haloplasma contractile]|uniref:58 protein n=1 Tax=Haloplasma contractile SSD-17B TaxID=1033810 RepID=F7PVF8_9MOLU|nr:YbaN family protein [Haloplasma contractile]ERJ12875.1 Putative 58 protein [Haloplasma contractile SSD-17B]